MARDYAGIIADLLRKAESTTPEEAELLYGKAQELMAKYAIDEAMIAAARGSKAAKDDPIVSEEFVTVGIYRFPLAKLTYYILINNLIKAIITPDAGWRTVGGKTYKETDVMMAVGLKSDLDRARVLVTSLHLQALRAENSWWKENEILYAGLKSGEKHKARRGFLFAFAEGAGTKLREATARGRKAADLEHGGESVALVLRDKSLAVSEKFDELFPTRRSVKDRKNHGDAFARSHGHAAGLRSDVGQPGVGGSKRELNG